MKIGIICIVFAFIIPMIAWAGIARTDENSIFENEVPICPNNRSLFLTSVLKKEVITRLPKNNPYLFRYLPSISPHNAIDHLFQCQIIFTHLTTQDQYEAVQIAIPYFQAFMDALNNTPQIRPFLLIFPVQINQCELSINFANDPNTKRPYYPPYISAVSLLAGRPEPFGIYQYVWQGPPSPHFKNIYDNSLGVVPEVFRTIDIPRFSSNATKKPLVIPSATKYSGINDSGKPEFEFALKFAAEHNLIFIASWGINPSDLGKNRKFCSAMTYAAQEQLLNIDQARELALTTLREHIAFKYKIGTLANFVNYDRKRGKETLSTTIDAQKYMSLRLSFWDKYIDRVKAPAIAEVNVYGNRIRYYVADDLQRLQLILEEELPHYDVEVPLPEETATK